MGVVQEWFWTMSERTKVKMHTNAYAGAYLDVTHSVNKDSFLQATWCSAIRFGVLCNTRIVAPVVCEMMTTFYFATRGRRGASWGKTAVLRAQ